MDRRKIKIDEVSSGRPDMSLIREFIKPLPRYELGIPPWSKEELKKAYFSDFIYTRESIKKHPGYLAHSSLQDIALSLGIFCDSVSNLLESVQTFRSESHSGKFWTRPVRSRLDELELRVRRGVFASATSAMALVDCSRIISHHFTIPEYQEKINAYFGNNYEHQFIQCLRNYVCHCRMIKANWHISWPNKVRCCQFLLKKNELLLYKKWGQLSKKYIKNHPDGIDVETLFHDYRMRVEEFHQWFHDQIVKVSEPPLSEYRRYEQMLNQFSVRSEYNILLRTVIDRKLDPYTYLDDFLTEAEKEKILKLPMRSPEQVDKIIEILDEYQACDAEIKEMTYKAFAVH